MAAGGETQLVRPAHGGPQRATYLEHFLDLAYVFALARVSQRLVEDFTVDGWRLLPDVGETGLLVLALGFLWAYTTLIASRYNPEHPAIQLVVFGTMFASLVMAVSLPEAYGARGVVFAGAYVAIQIGRQSVLVIALRGHERRHAIVVRGLRWTMVSAVPWLAGAFFFQGGARALVWTLAVAIDCLGVILGFPTPRLGRVRIADWQFAGSHLEERYQQFVIIALGETIVLLGLTFTQNFKPGRAAAFVLSFATTVLLWRIYFHRAGTILAEAIAASPDPGRLGRAVPYTHLIMVAGILATGVGYPLVINHPLGHLNPAWLAVIFGGPAIFLAGRSRFEYEVFARVSRSRVVGLLALAVLAPVMLPLPPLMATTTAAAVLTGVAVNDAIRSRKGPPEAPSPPP
jgi:low temperature requirement protein LtrA